MFPFPLSIYHAKEEVWKFVLDDFKAVFEHDPIHTIYRPRHSMQTPKLVHNLQKNENKTLKKKSPTKKEIALFLNQRISSIPESTTYFYCLSSPHATENF